MHKNEQPVSNSLTEDQLDSIQNGHDFELFDRSHRTLQKNQ